MKITISLSIATMLAGLAAVPANADVVTFTTTGVFGCGTISATCSSTPTNTLTVSGGGNSSTLTYTGNAGTTVQPVPPPQVVNFGQIAVSESTLLPIPESFTGGAFTLTINQTSPAILGGNLSATLSGTLEFLQSQVVVQFAHNGVLTLGNEIYEIDNNGLVNIGSFSPTTITGKVDAFSGSGGSTPEPSFLGLTGLGLVGLAGMAMRRRRQRSIAA